MSDVDPIAVRLRDDLPGWRILRSSDRARCGSKVDADADVDPTVTCDTADGVNAALIAQREDAERNPLP